MDYAMQLLTLQGYTPVLGSNYSKLDLEHFGYVHERSSERVETGRGRSGRPRV